MKLACRPAAACVFSTARNGPVRTRCTGRANAWKGRRKGIGHYWPPAGGRCAALFEAGQIPRPVGVGAGHLHQLRGGVPPLDPKNNEEVPEGTEVIRIRAFSPIAAFKAFPGGRRGSTHRHHGDIGPEEPLAGRHRAVGSGQFLHSRCPCFWIRPAVRRIRELLSTTMPMRFSDGHRTPIRWWPTESRRS